jgi:hypothetical protein
MNTFRTRREQLKLKIAKAKMRSKLKGRTLGIDAGYKMQAAGYKM